MIQLKKLIQKSFISALVLLQVGMFPAAAIAQEAGADAPAPACPVATGTTMPTGASASTFTFNASTCLWENAYYTWSPVTKAYTSISGNEYIYNPTNGQWDLVVPPPPPAPTPAATINEAPAADTSSASTNPGEGSTSQTTANTGGATVLDTTNTSTLTNNTNLDSLSGNTTQTGNTITGSAATGNSSGAATVLNLLQSSFSQNGSVPLTFTANIDGDVVGDLVVDPGKIPPPLTVTGTTPSDLQVHVENDNTINNNIVVNAASGDATTADNTKSGDTTTGNAAAMANVINVINTAITSGQSFIGTININGNLDGDILLPPGMLDQLFASNAPRVTVDAGAIGSSSLVANINDTTNINNNVSATAASGSATLDQNTKAGSATSGDASTNVTIFNLTGKQVVGKNALLVFVNVMGSWVGLIMDAPAGTTAAALGGDLSQDVAIVPLGGNTTIDSETTNTINNNIMVNAKSGDATAKRNTITGDVKSGDAVAGVNLLNIANSGFSFSDWFGVLFINVFGTWKGSFGVNTSAGNPILQPGRGNGNPPSQTAVTRDSGVMKFVPKVSQSNSSRSGSTFASTRHIDSSNETTSKDESVVLASTDSNSNKPITAPAQNQTTVPKISGGTWKYTVFAGIAAAMMLAVERILAVIKQRRLA